MPIYDRSQATKSGWAQVRAALVSFVGTVTKVEVGQWGGQLFDENGNPVAPREFLEITNENVEVLETSEELSMDIEGEPFTFRVNCSASDGSFWVDEFLASADKFKILLPDGLVGKRITWKKVTKKGRIPKFDSSNLVIAGIGEAAVKKKVAILAKVEIPTVSSTDDPMELAAELAVGKTEAQFRSAIGLDQRFAGHQLLPLAKMGAVTDALVKEGRLVIVKEGNKMVYQRPEGG